MTAGVENNQHTKIGLKSQLSERHFKARQDYLTHVTIHIDNVSLALCAEYVRMVSNPLTFVNHLCSFMMVFRNNAAKYGHFCLK